MKELRFAVSVGLLSEPQWNERMTGLHCLGYKAESILYTPETTNLQLDTGTLNAEALNLDDVET